MKRGKTRQNAENKQTFDFWPFGEIEINEKTKALFYKIPPYMFLL